MAGDPSRTGRMTPEQAAAASRPTVLDLGDAFTRCPATRRRARLLGLSGWAFHIAARGGALGAVRAETVAACLGFLAPDPVVEGWDAAARVADPREVALVGFAECRRWGDEHLAAVPGVDRLADLLHRVVAAAGADALPLFAAWRAVPAPDRAGPVGRAGAVGSRLKGCQTPYADAVPVGRDRRSAT